jgi:hypothetical protein
MPLSLTLSTALVLILDGFLLGVGWIVAQAIYDTAIWVLSRKRAP